MTPVMIGDIFQITSDLGRTWNQFGLPVTKNDMAWFQKKINKVASVYSKVRLRVVRDGVVVEDQECR